LIGKRHTSARKEKRARRRWTRPEPTIYGNCDSWNFIVGKKACAYRPENGKEAMLRTGNKTIVHSLFTILVGSVLDNLWAICGSPVDYTQTSRMVVSNPVDMLKSAGLTPRFYPILSLTHQ
jgi:hypothetical protein